MSTRIITLMDNSDDISALVDELSSFRLPVPYTNEAKGNDEELKDEDVQKYVLKQSKALIDLGVGMTHDLASTATSSANPDDVAALAEIMSATSKLIENLNKTSLMDKKAATTEKLKLIDIAAKKEIAQLQADSQKPTNMNVLVASREDIMKKLFPKDSEVIQLPDR